MHGTLAHLQVVACLLAPGVPGAVVPQAAPPEPTAPTATVTIGASAARTGDGLRVTSTVRTHNAVLFTVDGAKLRDFKQEIEDRRAFDVALVALDALVDRPGGRRAARIDYQECTSTLTDPSGDDSRLLPTFNRSYLVFMAAEPSKVPAVTVRELSEQDELYPTDARPEVAAQAERDATELLIGARLAPLVAKGPLAVGQPIDVPPEIARSLLAGVLDEVTLSRFQLTPKPAAADAERVAFAASLVVSMKQGGGAQQEATLLPVESTFDLAGEIVVARASGRLLALDLAGPIRFGGKKEGGGTRVEVSGTGTLTWTYRAEPLAKQ